MAASAFPIPSPNAVRLADPALREALLKYARRRLSPGEVEDLVQNTLTEALSSSNAPIDEGDFRRWLHGIARHKIVDSYRRRGRAPAPCADIDGFPGDAAGSPGELAQWVEHELPKTEGARATLQWLLRESDGESLDEIARDLALPAPRVRQRVSRLRRHFHARWLALAAIGVVLLAAGLALHSWRELPTPPIARELPAPFESAAPSADPPAPPPRAPAGVPESETPSTPKQLVPRKSQPSDVRSKGAPKQRRELKKKQAPSKKALTLPSKLVTPSKPSATERNELDLPQGSSQFLGAKKKD